MHFSIQREALLKPLQLVAGVVERRQTLPVLSNVLLVVQGQQLSLTGTDLEVELVGRVALEDAAEPGEITVPARKLMDICKSLPSDALISIRLDDQKVVIKSGRSRFTLSTLPANDFPTVEEGPGSLSFTVAQGKLRKLIERSAFAMAQQDVRYYLNGIYLHATEAEGAPLDAEHGGPARLLIPHLYFWKSAKWISKLTLLHRDQPGFWEQNGYNIYGDPWKEQRYW